MTHEFVVEGSFLQVVVTVGNGGHMDPTNFGRGFNHAVLTHNFFRSQFPYQFHATNGSLQTHLKMNSTLHKIQTL